VWVLWLEGFLTAAQQLFVFSATDGKPLVGPEFELATGGIFGAALVAGLILELRRTRRTLLYLGAFVLVDLALSLCLSKFVGLDVFFAPLLISGTTAAVSLQVKRLWETDRELSAKVNSIAAITGSSDANASRQRLTSGLKLLNTMLSPTEAVVFVQDRHQG